MALPSGYKRVEYIESNGSQYINTEFKPNQDTKVYCNVNWVPKSSGSSYLFGAETSSKVSSFLIAGYNGRWRLGYNTSESYFSEENFLQPVDVLVDKNSATINSEETVSVNYSTFSTAYPIFIFATNRGGNPYGKHGGKLYFFKIYDNNNLIRDFIPVISSSNIYGLYDLVNNKFYTSASSTPFSGGQIITTLNMPVNIGGSWKDSDSIHVNIGGTWKEVEAAYVNIDGAWKELG